MSKPEEAHLYSVHRAQSGNVFKEDQNFAVTPVSHWDIGKHFLSITVFAAF